MPEPKKCEHHPLESLDSDTGSCALCASDLPVEAVTGSPDAVATPGDAVAGNLSPSMDAAPAANDESELVSVPKAQEPEIVLPLQTRGQRPPQSADAAGADRAGTNTVEAETIVKSRATETADDDGAAKVVQNSAEEAAFFAELDRVKQKKLFAILFLGFRTAGKTWLLHRIKHELFSGNGPVINCDPPFQPIPDGIKMELPGSSKIEFHRVFASPDTFVLIDIPGEAAEDLMQGRFGDLRMLLAAMDYAGAMIVALPSDILFLGDVLPSSNADLLAPALPKPKRTAEKPETDGTKRAAKAAPRIPAKMLAWAKDLRILNSRLEQFTAGLFRAVGMLSYLRHARIEPADQATFAKIDVADVIDHLGEASDRRPIGGQDGLNCPTFFALTKSDRVLSLLFDDDDPTFHSRNLEIRKSIESRVLGPLAERAKLKDEANRAHLRDPWELVRRVRPALHSQLVSSFPLGKFDYVTAFYGHESSTYLTREHYKRHPQRGVVEILEWIAEAQQLGGRRLLLRLRLSHFILAARARRYLAGYRSRRKLPRSQKRHVA